MAKAHGENLIESSTRTRSEGRREVEWTVVDGSQCETTSFLGRMGLSC